MSNYKLMPEKATPEMEQAAEKYWNQRRFKGLSDDPRTWAGVYQALLSEAPTINIVATKNEQGQIVSVTLQDEDHHILEVIAEADMQEEPVASAPVAAQQRFRHLQKSTRDWSAWQPASINLDRPSWEIDSQGYEVEYRLLYDASQPTEQQPISAYAYTVPDDCETLHWRGQILSMNELVSVQPTPCQECGGDGAGGEHEEDCVMAQIAPEVAVSEIIEAVADFVGSQKGGPFAPAVIKAAIIGQLEYGDEFTKLFTSPAPQPAPDVAGLVEALEWLRGAINTTPENDMVQAGIWISTKHPRIKQIDAILATHRKNGGEK